MSAASASDTTDAALLRAAAALDRLIDIAAPDAPGLVFAGAEFDGGRVLPGLRRFHSAGVGRNRQEAFAACVGEMVEIISQIERPGDIVEHAAPQAVAPDPPIAAWIVAHDADPRAVIDWIPARRLHDGGAALLPADLCLRRAPGSAILSPTAPLSLGCGAGTTLQQAWLHGLLERIERDAVALWWRGAAPPRTLRLGHAGLDAAGRLLVAARGDSGQPARPTWLLDIASEIGIPCIAALSCNEAGFAVALGAAARLDGAGAATAAVLELCQLELAAHLLAARHREGDTLTGRDHAHLHRLTAIDAGGCDLLHAGPPAVRPDARLHDLDGLVETLLAHGAAVYGVDLTRPPLGIPAGLVVCPFLEDAPGQRTGPRLRQMRARTGGPPASTGGASLM